MGNEGLRAQWSEVVAELRRARGDATQRQLAEQLGLAVNSVQDWELLRDWPTVPHLFCWARAVGVQVLVEDEQHSGSVEVAVGVAAPFEAREYLVVAAVLRRARVYRGIDQELLAKRIGVSRFSVIRWESGRRYPRSCRDLLAWADALGCALRLRQLPRDA